MKLKICFFILPLVFLTLFCVLSARSDVVLITGDEDLVYCNSNDVLEIAEPDVNLHLLASVRDIYDNAVNYPVTSLESPNYVRVKGVCNVYFWRQPNPALPPQLVKKVLVQVVDKPAFDLEDVSDVSSGKINVRIAVKDAGHFIPAEVIYMLDGKTVGMSSIWPFDYSIPARGYDPGNHFLTAYALNKFGACFQVSKTITICPHVIDVSSDGNVVYCARSDTLKIASASLTHAGATSFRLCVDGQTVRKISPDSYGGGYYFLWTPDLKEGGEHLVTVECVYDTAATSVLRHFHILLAKSEPLAVYAPASPRSTVLNVSVSMNAGFCSVESRILAGRGSGGGGNSTSFQGGIGFEQPALEESCSRNDRDG